MSKKKLTNKIEAFKTVRTIRIRAVFLYEKNGIFHYIDERLASYSRYNDYGHCYNDKRLKYLHKKFSLI